MFSPLMKKLKLKIFSIPATVKIRTVKQTITHGLNLVVINHSYPILNFFLNIIMTLRFT